MTNKGYTLRQMKLRNQQIREYKVNNPDATLAEMKKLFHVSRQRIHAILNNGLNGVSND
jgi:DNA-directed RNA polymerase sigma subunit (sigma70/sigma32)